MQRNTTPKDAGDELPPSQTRALAFLAGGATVTAATSATGVDRTTVHRWLRDDFAFQAACNAVRCELRRELEIRLERTVHVALETVCAAIEGGDVRAALTVLKGGGFLAQKPLGSADPSVLEEEADLVESERRSVRSQRRLLASF